MGPEKATTTSLEEFDRQAEAAAQREQVRQHHLSRSQMGGPTRELRCGYCSYFLREFKTPVTPFARYLERDLFERDVRPRLTRPWRTMKCRKCHWSTAFYTSS